MPHTTSSVLASVAVALVASLLTGCRSTDEGIPTLHTIEEDGLTASFDSQRGRLVEFGPAGGPNLLHTTSLKQTPDPDGGYTFYGGMYTWVAPQSTWVDAEGGLRDWPPDPAMDRGPQYVTRAQGNTLAASGETSRLGLSQDIDFRLIDERHALVTLTLTNESDATVSGSPWIITAARPGAVIAAPRPTESDHLRLSDSEHAPRLWSTITDGHDDSKWVAVTTSEQPWWSRPGDDLKAFLSTRPNCIATWDRGHWFIRYVSNIANDERLIEAGESPIEIYVNYGLGLFEAELLGPLATLESGQSVSLVEHWKIVEAAEADLNVLDAAVVALRERVSSRVSMDALP